MKGLAEAKKVKASHKKKRITPDVARNIKEDLRGAKYLEANIEKVKATLHRMEYKYHKEYSFRSLADKHKCTEATIKDIKYGRSWKDVEI